MDKISQEDLYFIRELKNMATIAVANADKAHAEARAAEAEAKYGILSIYMKYNLSVGKDKVVEDGTIIRWVEPPSETENKE